MEPQPPGAEVSVTAEQVKEAQKQTEASYRQLMDQMEASVPQNGEFFIKVGHKPAEPNIPDGRALILKSAIPKNPQDLANNTAEYVAITEKGPMLITLKPADLTGGTGAKGFSFRYDETTNGGQILSKESFSNVSSHPPLILKSFGNNAEEMNRVKDTMQSSIEAGRKTSEQARNKKALDTEQGKQAQAKGLSDLLGQTVQPSSAQPPPPANPAL